MLGTDRFGGAAASANRPARARRDGGASPARPPPPARSLEVCGEAASEPAAVPLLVGLGAGELSVGAARVGAVRGLDPGAALATWPAATLQAALLGAATQPASVVERDGRVVAVGPEA